MKRFLAILLILTTLITMCAPLAGCSSSTPLQMGTWLSLIADSFGMVSYTSTKPYFEKVGEGDVHFNAFQLAAEWEVLEPSNEISSTTEVKWEDALVTLVNAGEFLPFNSTEDEKIAFAIENFDPEIRTYWMNRNIKLSEAMPLLEKAVDMWVNSTYTEKIETLEFGEDVTNLLDEENLEYEMIDNVVRIDKDKVSGLKPGDIYTLPNTASGGEASVNKVSSIEYDGDTAIITNEMEIHEEELAQQVQNIQIRGTAPVDFSNITGIYDAQGNAIYTAESGINTALTSVMEDEFANVYVSTLETYEGDAANAANAGFFDKVKGSLTFKIGEKFKASLEIGKNSLGIEVTGTEKKNSKYRELTKKTSVSMELSDVSLTKDIDYSWGKLHSATVKLDYKAKISGGVSFEKERKVGEKFEGDNFGTASLSAIKSGFAQMVENIKRDVYETKYDNDSIYICRLRLVEGGIGNLDLIVEGKLSVTGEFKLTISLAGAKGVQYKNGNLRYISSKNPTVTLTGEATTEVTVCPGIEVGILKVITVKVTADVGVGGKFSAKVYLVDAEWHKLYTGDAVLTQDDANNMNQMTYTTSAEDILAEAEAAGATWKGYKKGDSVEILPKMCIEIVIYPVLNISGSIEIGKWEVGATWPISGADNAKLSAKGHLDIAWNSGDVGGGWDPGIAGGRNCSYEFKPWDDSVEKLEEVEETLGTDPTAATYESILTSSTIVLSTSSVFLNKGETQTVTVTGLPEGYEPGDLVGESDNSKIAKISILEGKIYAGTQAGSTIIKVSTSDGKHSMQIAVTVHDDVIDNFQGLGGGKSI